MKRAGGTDHYFRSLRGASADDPNHYFRRASQLKLASSSANVIFQIVEVGRRQPLLPQLEEPHGQRQSLLQVKAKSPLSRATVRALDGRRSLRDADRQTEDAEDLTRPIRGGDDHYFRSLRSAGGTDHYFRYILRVS